MAIKLENDWIWDSWYVRDGDTWHGYFLKAPKSLINPDLRHFNVTQGHAVSKDLVNWEELPPVLLPGEEPAIDADGCWTTH